MEPVQGLLLPASHADAPGRLGEMRPGAVYEAQTPFAAALIRLGRMRNL